MTDNQSDDNRVSRRSLLAGGWSWLRWLAGAMLFYPVFRFVSYRAPKQPRYVKVDKVLPVGGFALEHDFIIFVDESGAWAVSRKCTHLGCRLNFQEKEGILLCPCHQSRFSKSGERISGPAQKNLPLFTVAKQKEGEVEKGYIVTL